MKTATHTHTSVFHSSDPNVINHIDDNRDELVPAEIEDEQIRVTLASRLSLHQSDSEGDLWQIYHSND